MKFIDILNLLADGKELPRIIEINEAWYYLVKLKNGKFYYQHEELAAVYTIQDLNKIFEDVKVVEW